MTIDREELFELLESLCDGAMTPAQHRQLQERLSVDATARQFYFDYLDLRLHLRQWQRTCVGERSLGMAMADASVSAPILMQSAPLHAPVSPIYSPMGSFAFSYIVAALIVGLGLLVGWVYHVPEPRMDRRAIAEVNRLHPPPSVPTPREVVVVGRVTGTAECRWANAKKAATLYAPVAVGREYKLVSGLLEITYNNGARVILQGPCTYRVKSVSSGNLLVGRLNAKIEKKSITSFWSSRTPSSRESENSPEGRTAGWFTVYTPTATITDLGTEFGVVVEESGASTAKVFEGKVELRTLGNKAAKPISLQANEAVRVVVDRDGMATVLPEKGSVGKFLREMPKSLPIVLHNTGIGLKVGDPDPNWELVSRSDDPNFKPRPSRVRVAGRAALENDPTRSQWISLVGEDVELPEEVVYVFRTTFDLTGMSPSTAVLRGKFIADDRVTAIRLNGRRLSYRLPPEGEPFIYWTDFKATTGFVKGVNVLEVQVLNAAPFSSPSQRRFGKSRMSCRIELEGEVCHDPELGTNEDRPADKTSLSLGHRNETTSKGR